MAFLTVKTFLMLILPPASILLLMLAGLFLLGRRPRTGRRLLAIGVVLLYLLSLPLTADMLMRPLESFAPPFADPPRRAQAVVVLGSGVRDLSWLPADPEPSEIATERLVKGVELCRKLRLPLVVSGGTGGIGDHPVREADAMAAHAERLGVPRRDIVVESRSRNTRENARETARLIAGRTIVLVTSAFHMRRSAALFTREGFDVLPAPAGYRSQARPVSAESIIPTAAHLSVSSTALSEYLSLLWYTMTGAI